MPDVADRLLETARSLPASLAAEVLDFAEFLRARQAGISSTPTPEPENIPLTALCGGLADSGTFKGDPAEIQARLRDEWS